MNIPTGITIEMTVREILKVFPQTRAVFDRYGMQGCGGSEGPEEPVSFFAEIHGLDTDELLLELDTAIAKTARSLIAPLPFPAARSCAKHSMKDPCPCGPEEIKSDPEEHRISSRAAALLNAPESQAGGRNPDLPVDSGTGTSMSGVGKCTHGEAAKNLARTFIRTALLVFLCYGALTGIAAFLFLTAPWAALPAVIQWPALVQSHAHAQMFGFVLMFILGISYHVMPRFMGGPLRNIGAAWASYGLLLGGLILRSLYQPFAQNPVAAVTTFLGSLFEVAAVGAFLSVIRSTLREHRRRLPERRSGQPFVHIRYLMAGGAWLLVSGTLAAISAGVMLVQEVNVQPAGLNEVWMNISIFGFAGMFIFGVGQRTMPHFLALDDLNPAAGRAAFAAFTAGLALQIASLGLPYSKELLATSAILELIGFSLFLIAVPLLGRLPVHRPAAPPFFASFVRAAFAFGWLGTAGYALAAVSDALGVAVPRTLTDAYRHAWTIGWITMLIVGVGYRLVPIFFGRSLSMPRAVWAIFTLMIGGVCIRIGADILSTRYQSAYAWTNLSGILILIAMAIFALEIWRLTATAQTTASQPARLAITPASNIAAVLEDHPQLLPIFVRHGFGALQNPVARKTVARFVSIEQAAKKHGVDPTALLNELRNAVGQE